MIWRLNFMESKWIVVTGLDGSGKTTFKNRLVGDLKSNGHKTQNFKSPYDKHLLGLLDISGDGMPWKDNYSDQLIFMLDNRMLSYYVRDWRQNYEYLISQRGFMIALFMAFAADSAMKRRTK